MTENDIIIQRIKDFEDRYLMKFQISFPMCEKLGLQHKRLVKIISKEIEPTFYETVVLERFLKLPHKTKRRSATVINGSV